MISFPSPDHQRMYHLYRYLFTCLAMARKKDGSPNFKGISDRLSTQGDFRKTVSELLQASFSEPETETNHPHKTLWKRIGQVTTGEIVQMLAQLQQHLDEDYKKHKTLYTDVLTPDDLLLVLHKLIELTPLERKQLKLTASDNVTLLQQAFLALQQSGGVNNHQTVFQLYRSAVGLNTVDHPPFQSLTEVDDCIQETVEQMLTYLPERPERLSRQQGNTTYPSTDKVKTELTQKAQREMRRLLARSGNGYPPGYYVELEDGGTTNIQSYIQHYFDRAFVTKLAQTVVANERLTDQFPIYLKRVSIHPVGPLPFAADKKLGILTTDEHYQDLLHPALKWIDQGTVGYPDQKLPLPGDYELASQDASLVDIEFYIKLPKGYQPSIERVFQTLASQNRDRIDFVMSSRGIGGTLSHAVKIINTVLLRDIPCLQEYFSIAHDVTSTQAIIRDNVPSPVWAHNLIKLCRKSTMAEALLACQRDRICSYEALAFAEPIGQGDYCGFDFFRAQAHAALQARLQAIRHTGVRAKSYLQELCQRIEQTIALEDAWSYLRGYPFSSLAMQGTLETELLTPKVGDRPLNVTDPYICFDACLSIIEAYLDEGGYRPARQYLDRISVLEQFVQQGLAIAEASHANGASPRGSFSGSSLSHPSLSLSDPSFTDSLVSGQLFSGRLLTRYLICLANYYYLYDTNDPDAQYLPPNCHEDVNREVLVQRAWQMLDQAQTHIQIRLRKYVIINEVSQATFHPHYCLLSRISFLRAKLLLFFSRFVPRQAPSLITDQFPGQRRTVAATHWGQLYLAEKARLYAAADGDSEIYACYTSMQCWLHLMAAYADPDDLRLPTSLNGLSSRADHTLSTQQCLEWAQKLRDHALISYAEVGRQYYYQIKEKSGLPRNTPPRAFGCYWIESMPAIYEARGEDYHRLYQQFHTSADDPDSLWVWDMSLLTIDPSHLPKLSPSHPKQVIYLFGTNACYLFFARGMYLLCSDTWEEFESGCSADRYSADKGDRSSFKTASVNPRSSPQKVDTSTNTASRHIEWDAKLVRAMRLLNLAWAIAEEGGQLHRDSEQGNGDRDHEDRSVGMMAAIQQGQTFRLTRSTKMSDRPNEYCSPEINAVRDLYPRRVNEIADLGKVFSAACMTLRLYIVSEDEQGVLMDDIVALLNGLHDNYRLTETSRQILIGQPRYNGHLERHLDQIKMIILRTAESAQTNASHASPSSLDVPHLRRTLLKDIFAAILRGQ